MPERAAEGLQAPDDTREQLIAKAATTWAAGESGIAPPGDLGRAVGDLAGLPRRVLPAGRPRGPDRRRAGQAGRDGRGSRRARREPAAGPRGGPGRRGRRRLPDRGGDRHRRRHRRHAVPGRLGHHGAQPAPRRHPAHRSPDSHCPPGRGRGSPGRGRDGRRRGRGPRVLDPRRDRSHRRGGGAGRGPAPRARRPARRDGRPAADALGRPRPGRDPGRRRPGGGGGQRAARLAVGRPLHLPGLPGLRPGGHRRASRS